MRVLRRPGRAPGRRRRPRAGRRRHEQRGGGQPPALRQGARPRARAGPAVAPGLDDDLAEHGRHWEFEAKGGLVVSDDRRRRQDALEALAVHQRARRASRRVAVGTDELPAYEPHLTRDLAGGVFYPQDAQVQPMLLTAHLLRLARELGAQVVTGSAVTGFLRDGRRGDRRPDLGRATISAPAVLNAAGTWSGEVARLAGVHLPVLPRRGFVLVTQPLPPVVRHKVYGASYVADVASSDEALQTSPVVEGTPSGTVLIGASRERVGFDRTPSLPVLARLAAAAAALFPVLRDASLIRAYAGFRPYCPDHLPVIGPDPRAPGLWHACGHEGAGIGLSRRDGRRCSRPPSPARRPSSTCTPFRPERFDAPRRHADEELAGAR